MIDVVHSIFSVFLVVLFANLVDIDIARARLRKIVGKKGKKEKQERDKETVIKLYLI